MVDGYGAAGAKVGAGLIGRGRLVHQTSRYWRAGRRVLGVIHDPWNARRVERASSAGFRRTWRGGSENSPSATPITQTA